MAADRLRTIRLMADYFSYPLWWADGSDVGDIEPHSLSISLDLANTLMEWAEQFDLQYNEHDPALSGFDTPTAALLFDIQGRHLWYRLQAELQGQYEVLYTSIVDDSAAQA